MATDFEAEGLLEGLDGDARAARLALLEKLESEGCELDELQQAAAEDRLALLLVERELSPEGERLTFGDLAQASKLEPEFLTQLIRALGLPRPDEDEPFFTSADLEAAETVRTFLDAGMDAEPVLEISRVIGNSLSHVVAAVRMVIADTFYSPGDTEHDVAVRFAGAAQGLYPALESVIRNMLRAHLLAALRQDTIGVAELAAGRPLGQQQMTVCFADLVGFTRLGEQVASDQLGGVAGRLTAMAVDVASPPVRLVKMIGDAAMLVATEPEPVLEAALTLVEAADAEGEEFPQLRAGVACGDVMGRSGDFFGRPVNLASRITDLARPGSVVAAPEVRDEVGDAYDWSRLRGRRIKGIGDIDLFRVRRLSADEDEAAEVDDVGG